MELNRSISTLQHCVWLRFLPIKELEVCKHRRDVAHDADASRAGECERLL
jgi:hypothetical protein